MQTGPLTEVEVVKLWNELDRLESFHPSWRLAGIRVETQGSEPLSETQLYEIQDFYRRSLRLLRRASWEKYQDYLLMDIDPGSGYRFPIPSPILYLSLGILIGLALAVTIGGLN